MILDRFINKSASGSWYRLYSILQYPQSLRKQLKVTIFSLNSSWHINFLFIFDQRPLLSEYWNLIISTSNMYWHTPLIWMAMSLLHSPLLHHCDQFRWISSENQLGLNYYYQWNMAILKHQNTLNLQNTSTLNLTSSILQ